jgi:thymidylate synthase ThyX
MSQIFVVDNLHAEDLAMLQALYSRSDKSVTDHLKKVEETGSGQFMERYYLGYGHQSIAQCGSTTLFFENISLLAAKAIEDSLLFNGQECSTRYLNFSKRDIYKPIETDESNIIINNWMEFYNEYLPIITEHLKTEYINLDRENEVIYNKAIESRAFDIMRGFLPCGVTTNVSLHTTLNHAYNHLSTLKYHPLNEVNELANNAWEKLFEKYPHSFKSVFIREQEEYLAQITNATAYSECYEDEKIDFDIYSSISNDLLVETLGNHLENRPKGSLLPKSLRFYGEIRIEFTLDFGSYRDYQRHRSISTYSPLINGTQGFNDWYINQFPFEIRSDIKRFVSEQFSRIYILKEKNQISKENLQYYYPLGTNIRIGSVGYLNNFVYIAELRSQKTVHPTLRKIAIKIGNFLQERFPSLKLYVDFDKEDFVIKRGNQDIFEK